MSEEDKDNVQTGNQDEGAADPKLTDNQKIDLGKGQEEQEDPGKQLEAFKTKALDEVKKRQQLEAEKALLQQQLEQAKVVSANPQQQQRPKSLRESVIEQLGLKDETWLTTTQQIQVDNIIDSMRDQQIRQQQFISQNQDFNDVVGKVNPLTNQFEPSEHLKDAITQNPNLSGLDRIVAQNPAYAVYAYTVAKQAKTIRELQTTKDKSDDEMAAIQKQQELNNKLSPISSASTGGGSAGNAEQRIASMKIDERDALFSRVLSGEFDDNT